MEQLQPRYCDEFSCCFDIAGPWKVARINVISEFMVQLIFSTGMLNNAALSDKNSYQFTPLDGGNDVHMRQVTVQQKEDYPQFVLLQTTVQSSHKRYRITVNENVLDRYGRSCDIPTPGVFTGRTSSLFYNADVLPAAFSPSFIQIVGGAGDTFSSFYVPAPHISLPYGENGARGKAVRMSSLVDGPFHGLGIARPYLTNRDCVRLTGNFLLREPLASSPQLGGVLVFPDNAIAVFAITDGGNRWLAVPRSGTLLTPGDFVKSLQPVDWLLRFNLFNLKCEGENGNVTVNVNGETADAISVPYNDIGVGNGGLLNLFNSNSEGFAAFLNRSSSPAIQHTTELDLLSVVTQEQKRGNNIDYMARRTKVDEHDTNLMRNMAKRGKVDLLQWYAGIGVTDDDLGGDF